MISFKCNEQQLKQKKQKNKNGFNHGEVGGVKHGSHSLMPFNRQEDASLGEGQGAFVVACVSEEEEEVGFGEVLCTLIATQ